MITTEGNDIFPAAYDGNFEAIKLYFDNGISPNIRNEDGKTLLHVACEDGYSGLLELVLEYGADPNIEDKDGDTPIDYAIFRDFKDCQQILKGHGAIVRDRQPAIERNWQLINDGQEQVRAVQNLLSIKSDRKITKIGQKQ